MSPIEQAFSDLSVPVCGSPNTLRTGADEDDLGGDDDDDDDPLNSDDDDDEEDSEVQTDNLVLCQYDKVTRTKNKWKAQLKFGVPRPSRRAPSCFFFAILAIHVSACPPHGGSFQSETLTLGDALVCRS